MSLSIVLVGRPNVGKSTLFNVLTKTRDALVADVPGLTRDRQYGQGEWEGKPFILIDTGGLAEAHDQEMDMLTEAQVQIALQEADRIIFMVDAKAGLTAADEVIARRLRLLGKPITLVINKCDRQEADYVASEFYRLGMGNPIVIAAAHRRGIGDLMVELLVDYKAREEELSVADKQRNFVAVIGRPNVGKSTLINRILGEDRVVVCDRPGTTRDSIYIPFDRRDKQYMLIDTAGIRRKSRVTETIEKFSVIKTLQAIEEAAVCVVVIDARQGVSDQDLHIIGWVVEAGKGLVLAFNKWDGLDDYAKDQFKQIADRKLSFVDFARRYYLSALHGTGVGKLYLALDEAYHSSHKALSTAELTRTLEEALKTHQPPLINGRRIKLRYAHVGSHNPLVIVIHGKQVKDLPNAYERYLAHFYREAFDLQGIPVQLRFKNDANPYVDPE